MISNIFIFIFSQKNIFITHCGELPEEKKGTTHESEKGTPVLVPFSVTTAAVDSY